MRIPSKMFPAFALTAVLLFLLPQKSSAIPAFSRKYATSCMTCHVDFPKLNDFGKAFKDAGFKFPEGDEDQIKSPPVMLGADAQKLNFPNSVWPGSIPGMPPIGLRFNPFFQLTGANRNQFNELTPAGSVPQVIPGDDFASGLFSIFTAGNFGSNIAFWVDDDISVGGSNSAGGLGDAYLKFVNVSRFLKLPKDSISVRIGQFELDLPITQARSYNLSPSIFTPGQYRGDELHGVAATERVEPVHVRWRRQGDRIEWRAPVRRLSLLCCRGR